MEAQCISFPDVLLHRDHQSEVAVGAREALFETTNGFGLPETMVDDHGDCFAHGTVTALRRRVHAIMQRPLRVLILVRLLLAVQRLMARLSHYDPLQPPRAAPKRSLKPMKAAVQVPAVGRLLSRQRDINDIKHNRRIGNQRHDASSRAGGGRYRGYQAMR
jgi:hypothetical protein